MQSAATDVEQYFNELPEDRKIPMDALRKVILQNLPAGFSEEMSYGMVGYVVPHSIYPAGYHCKPSLPLPFISIASQKNSISLYHMGMYADPELIKWFQDQYPVHCKSKLDMGKSCVKFKKVNEIPYDLIGELVSKMTPVAWIKLYETAFKK